MTLPTTIDAGAWLGKYLEGPDGDGDLARAMLKSFAEAVMSAQASMQYRGVQPCPGGPGAGVDQFPLDGGEENERLSR